MSGTALSDFYLRELHALREEASAFAREHPAVARELGLGRGRSTDPHVELLLQSFAYLAGRLNYQLEAEQSTLPNALLTQLYPHLEAPVPSMAVAQVEVKPDGANFANGWTLARQRLAHATTEGEGHGVKCRFRTAYETPLWPLEAVDAGIVPTNRYDVGPEVHSVLAVSVRATGNEPIQDLPLSSLRFFLHGEESCAFGLYSLLSASLTGIAVRIPGEERYRRLPPEAVHWLGFELDEAALPERVTTHSGYRLMQEYCAFPEKFLFFEVRGLDLRGAISHFELLFLFDTLPAKGLGLRPDALRLNCVPLVNLFPQPLDPLRLDHRHHEYRLSADAANHRYCEIYALEELSAVRADAAPRVLSPYFAMERHDRLDADDYFYATRRADSHLKSVPGTELYCSFLDLHFDPVQPPAEIIGGRALCTNRRLPERLRAGDRLRLEGPGPVTGLRLLTKPTPHRAPPLSGTRPWGLVAQLGLNHLSLGTSDGCAAMQSMLRLHAGEGSAASLKQIESLVEMRASPSLRPAGREPWRGFCRGFEVRMVIDEDLFQGGSPLLFGQVMRRFLALYAHLNSFVELVLESRQRKGVWKRWPPLAGAQTEL